MAVPAASISSVRPTGTIFELEALEGLPCGCVAGVYQARPTVVEVEFVEAKGPHCVFSGHRTGKVTRLGVPENLMAETGEPLV